MVLDTTNCFMSMASYEGLEMSHVAKQWLSFRPQGCHAKIRLFFGGQSAQQIILQCFGSPRFLIQGYDT